MSRKPTTTVTKEQHADIQAIATWLLANVPTVTSEQQATTWASIVVLGQDYDRTQPITDNRVAGFVFDMPAPAELMQLNS